jgi:hypothetical protein
LFQTKIGNRLPILAECDAAGIAVKKVIFEKLTLTKFKLGRIGLMVASQDGFFHLLMQFVDDIYLGFVLRKVAVGQDHQGGHEKNGQEKAQFQRPFHGLAPA